MLGSMFRLTAIYRYAIGRNLRLLFGASFALAIHQKLSVWISCYLFYRNYALCIKHFALFKPFDGEIQRCA